MKGTALRRHRQMNAGLLIAAACALAALVALADPSTWEEVDWTRQPGHGASGEPDLSGPVDARRGIAP